MDIIISNFLPSEVFNVNLALIRSLENKSASEALQQQKVQIIRDT